MQMLASNSPNKPRAATIRQFSDLTGIHPKTLYSQASAGTPPVPVFRSGRKILISRHHLEQLLGAEAVASVLDRGIEDAAALAS